MADNGKNRQLLSPLKQAYLALEETQARLEALESRVREPVAVIGIGCRFPGGVDSPESFWSLVRDGVDAITEIPPDRWDADTWYDPDPDAIGKMATRWGGFLTNVDRFDAKFFGIAPREAASMDPQQRLLLEVAWEALEHAAIAPTRLGKSPTGVYLGIASNDYAQMQLQAGDAGLVHTYYASGIAHSIASGRISYILGLMGPSVSVDTACSSSLVAIHLAVQALRNGDCDMALAGGVNAILTPETTMALSRTHMMASDGRCKAFDAAADGFVRGEGCGIIVLKPLSSALQAGDRILAVLRGSAANQDGPSSGLTAPNGPSQEAVIRSALRNAGVQPHQIGYVETHGTGTALGDPIEVQALGRVLAEGRHSDRPFLIGSVKTNIGHCEAAAGVAGVIKTILALRHRTVPPHLHFRRPNPHIPWGDLPVHVATRETTWEPIEGVRYAGVSSFGFSGTNVHLILQEAPRAEAPLPQPGRTHHILVISAKSDSALHKLGERYSTLLQSGDQNAIEDLCAASGSARAHFAYRIAVVGRTGGDLQSRLAAALSGDCGRGCFVGTTTDPDPPKVAFLFTGQGAQYPGMGRLLDETLPEYRTALDRCDSIIAPSLGRSIRSVLYADDGDDSLLNQTAYTQPALFALEYALAEVWKSWGLVPAMVAGHSVGEFVAACAAGLFSLEDGLRMVTERGRLMQQLPPGGRMAAVFADPATVRAKVEAYGPDVSIAALNGPSHVVISGTGTTIETIVKDLARTGITCKDLKVSHAFHSPLMDPIIDKFEMTVRKVEFASPHTRIVSNLTGRPGTIEEFRDPAYWSRHIRSPVLYLDTVRTLHDAGCTVFLEIGPHPVLTALARECLPDALALWLTSLRRGTDDWQEMLSALAGAYARGLSVRWQNLDMRGGRARADLPTYPFERERFWFDARSTGSHRQSFPQAKDQHPLLGRRLSSPALEGSIVFESVLSPDQEGFFSEHVVFDMPVIPATVYIDTMTAAGCRALRHDSVQLAELEIREPLFLEPKAAIQIQVILRPLGEGKASCQFCSAREDDSGKRQWRVHAEATCSVQDGSSRPQAPDWSNFSELAADGRGKLDREGAHLLEEFERRGLRLGDHFKGIRDYRAEENLSVVRIDAPAVVTGELGNYYFHPAVLDACLQSLAAAMGLSEGGLPIDVLYMPVSIARCSLERYSGGPLLCRARVRSGSAGSGETIVGDVIAVDASGAPIAELTGITLRRTRREAVERAAGISADQWIHRVSWEAIENRTCGQPDALFIPRSTDLGEQLRMTIESLVLEAGLDRYEHLRPKLDRLCSQYILTTLRSADVDLGGGQFYEEQSLAASVGVAPARRRLFGRYLAILAEDGYLVRDGSGWRVASTPAADFWTLSAQELKREYPDFAGEIGFAERGGMRLTQLLQGAVNALELLFPGGEFSETDRIYHDSPFPRVYNAMVRNVVNAVAGVLPGGRSLRVVEVGAGTGGTSSFVFPVLPADRSTYLFTDISPHFLDRARRRFESYPMVEYRLLDLEADPVIQGLSEHGFDIVIAANIIHATADLHTTLAHVQRLLAPGGLLVMLEVTRAQRWVDLSFGFTEGWWKFADTARRPDYPLLSAAEWRAVLGDEGFEQIVSSPSDQARGPGLAEQALILARAPAAEPASGGGGPQSGRDRSRWVLMADRGGVAQATASALEEKGSFGVVASADAVRGDQAMPSDVGGIVYFGGLDAPGYESTTAEELARFHEGACGGVLRIVKEILSRGSSTLSQLWVITRGAQRVDYESTELAPHQAPLGAMLRSIALEHPELRCVHVDLDPARSSQDASLLAEDLVNGAPEPEVAYRAGVRFVARLRHDARGDLPPSSYTLVSEGTGNVEGLRVRASDRRSPSEGEVEIRVEASGLNFKDVMNVLGTYPGDPGPLGGECAGIVTRIGSNVAGVERGDRVLAVAPGSFSGYVTTRSQYVVRRPERMTVQQAATFPIAHITAFFALHTLARISSRDRILIHAAAGGVGMAAVQLAIRAGAEVYATAGTEAKRKSVRAMGVQHVMDSRTPNFANEILEFTGGNGVTIILNSLAGSTIENSFRVLERGGRYLELGKRDVWSAAKVASLGKEIRYHVIDWGESASKDPEQIGNILRECVALFERGELSPLPCTTFSLHHAHDAFRFMAQARHTGKICLIHDDFRLRIEPDEPGPVRGDSTYLVTGGMGGLGLASAGWLVDSGARSLVLMGRSGPDEEARAMIKTFESRGATVVPMRADVSSIEELERVAAYIHGSLPPVRGIVHAAGVLDDGAVVQQTWERFARVLAPKVSGTRNLERVFPLQCLDFLVCFSSLASVFGSRGQTNHAAANAFLDSLAHTRQAQGLPCVTINWGPWSEIGSAARHGVGNRAAEKGIGALAPETGLRILGRAIAERWIQRVVAPIDWRQFLQGVATPIAEGFFSYVRPVEEHQRIPRKQTAADVSMLERMRAASPGHRRSLLVQHIRSCATRILGGGNASDIDLKRPLSEMGLDSLMAVELRNLLGSSLENRLPATVLFDYPSVDRLAAYLLGILFPAADSAAREDGPSPMPSPKDVLTDLEHLSDEDVDRLIEERTKGES